MHDCCCLEPADTEERVACAACRTVGKPVDSLTVKALLTESALSRFEPVPYRFCPDSECEVTYFAQNGASFSKADVRVAVWQKEPIGLRMICYCFGENEADIALEIDRSGESHAVDRVRAQISAGRCACEVRNPRGGCCLGDVAAAVERMRRMHLKENAKK